MGRLTDDERAEVLLDAAQHGDAEAARTHGITVQTVSEMRGQLARGERVSGSGVGFERRLRNMLKQRIRQAQLEAQLALADASKREADDDRPDPQRTMALAAASKTYAEIEAVHEFMDQQLEEIEQRRSDRSARLTTAEEPLQLGEKDEAEE
jgi:hypothetical protein